MGSQRTLCTLTAFLGLCQAWGSTLITGGTIIDGSGKPGYLADVRISGDRILQIGHLKPRKGELVVSAKGMVLAPGFIDAHSHADSALDKLESQIRQGITTAIVGQDGYNPVSVREFFTRFKKNPPQINFATFSGHGTVRSAVMGKEFRRFATASEIVRMQALVAKDMKAGALGLSSGLEYDPGHYSNTSELVALAQTASAFGGMYISHVRDEGAGALDSFRELVRIAKEAKLPAQISHVKVAVSSVWGKGKEVVLMMASARKSGLDISADIYPYTYWQSTITALSISREWKDPQTWVKALEETGGPSHVRLTEYTPNPNWKGKTLAELESETGRTAPDLIVEIVSETQDGKGREAILCDAMTEADVESFILWPYTMFCSDGQGGGSHPRGAGSFPRVLARYVRERNVLTLPEAIRKMTSLPATRFGLRDRGLVRSGMKADLVVFNPTTIQDESTADDPTRYATGICAVLVNGKLVLRDNSLTGMRPGLALKRPRSR